MFNFLDFHGFYNGRLSLRKSFWLYFILLYMFVFRIGIGLLYFVFKDSISSGGGFNILGIVNLIVSYFVLVGTWRSASNLSIQMYQNKRLYMNIIWSWITKFFLIGTFLNVIYPYYFLILVNLEKHFSINFPLIMYFGSN